MKKETADDDMLEEIDDRITILKTNIKTIQANLSENVIPSVLSMNIDVYHKNKKKTLKLVKDAKSGAPSDKNKLKAIKDKETELNKVWDNFEKEVDLQAVKDKIKEGQDAGITNAEDIEKMMGEFREAALVINHENRKKKGILGEESKEGDKYSSAIKKKGGGVPRSLRMVDMESERYQEEKKKKLDSLPAEQQNEDLDNKSWMRCNIF